MNQDEIREWFEYRNGFLYWKKINGTKCRIGNLAGLRSKKRSSWYIVHKKKRYYAHRLIWIYFNGDIPDKMEVGHINGDKRDNRIENLKLVKYGYNRVNKDCSKKNNIYETYKTKSGVIMYYAKVRNHGKNYYYKSSDMEDIKQWAENLKKNLLNIS